MDIVANDNYEYLVISTLMAKGLENWTKRPIWELNLENCKSHPMCWKSTI